MKKQKWSLVVKAVITVIGALAAAFGIQITNF